MSNKNPQELEYSEKVKIRVQDLHIGMYVCELDRPWTEAPFLFQGFLLETPEDVAAVRTHCKYVYIDILRTRTERVTLQAPPPGSFQHAKKTASFEKEVHAAETTTKQTSSLLKSFIEDIQFGTSVDIQLAKDAVSDCVASILRNSDAMMFMTRMNQKDNSLGQHAMDTCVYSIIVGRILGLSVRQLEDLGTCGLVHDLGKVSVDDAILNKPGQLTVEEMIAVRKHTRLGRDILMSGRNIFSGTVDVAYGHHENLDGSGYPRGLQASAMNLNCRIISVVDKYDAIVNPRPYRDAYTHLDALNFLNKGVKANQIDAEVVNALVSYLGVYPPGTIVELSNGEKAIVLETNPSQRLRPNILVVRDAKDNLVARFVDMTLKTTDEQGKPYKIKTVHRPDSFGINLSDYRNVIMRNTG